MEKPQSGNDLGHPKKSQDNVSESADKRDSSSALIESLTSKDSRDYFRAAAAKAAESELLPKVDIKQIAPWLEQNFKGYDRNSDGALSDHELRVGLQKDNISKTDKATLKFLSKNSQFFQSGSSDGFKFDSAITTDDTKYFSSWMSDMNGQEERMKRHSPNVVAALEFVRDNFKLLDKDKSQSISRSEVRQALADPAINDEQKRQLSNLDDNFRALSNPAEEPLRKETPIDPAKVRRAQNPYEAARDVMNSINLPSRDGTIGTKELSQAIVFSNIRVAMATNPHRVMSWSDAANAANRMQNFQTLMDLQINGATKSNLIGSPQ